MDIPFPGSGEGGGKRKAGKEGLRALSRSELEKVLAAGNRARAWRAEARERRWAVVQERRRRQLAEEAQEGAEARVAAAEERAAEAEDDAGKWFWMMGEEVGRRRENLVYAVTTRLKLLLRRDVARSHQLTT